MRLECGGRSGQHQSFVTGKGNWISTLAGGFLHTVEDRGEIQAERYVTMDMLLFFDDQTQCELDEPTGVVWWV